jgi:hypothetical protein
MSGVELMDGKRDAPLLLRSFLSLATFYFGSREPKPQLEPIRHVEPVRER